MRRFGAPGRRSTPDKASSIGAAIARQLLHLDLDLALHFSSNRLAAEDLEAQLRTEYRNNNTSERFLRLTLHQADLSSVEETVRLCEEVRKAHGKAIDILISNAGYGKRIRDVWDVEVEEWEKMININLRAGFLLVKGVVEGMKKQRWGRIVFVSSIAAYGAGINGPRESPNHAVEPRPRLICLADYAASKGGTMGMMKNLSKNLAEYNISVNDVAPAMVGETGMLKAANVMEGLAETIPLRRLCEPEEVANVVSMYVRTGFATGQSIVVSGGLEHK